MRAKIYYNDVLLDCWPILPIALAPSLAFSLSTSLLFSMIIVWIDRFPTRGTSWEWAGYKNDGRIDVLFSGQAGVIDSAQFL